MIRNTFILLDGVGYKTEERLWRLGVHSWREFLNRTGVEGISSKQKQRHDTELELADLNLRNRSPQYFSKRLRGRDYWRIYPDFIDRACFLDIETTGLSSDSCDITVVGVFDGTQTRSFIKGMNLTRDALLNELSRYSMIITFYGAAFDLPFIKKKFNGVVPDLPHMDLCFASRRIGLKGGLKSIEKNLGIERNEEILNVDGFEAVRLWRRWERYHDADALERLVEYNKADVVNLKKLADSVYQKLREKTLSIPV